MKTELLIKKWMEEKPEVYLRAFTSIEALENAGYDEDDIEISDTIMFVFATPDDATMMGVIGQSPWENVSCTFGTKSREIADGELIATRIGAAMVGLSGESIIITKILK